MPAGAHRPAATPRVAVAVSGGIDSTALLHATLRQARSAGIEVHALHVHHGLQADADRWLRVVTERCRRWGSVPLHVHRVTARPAPGDSVEAWARAQRYAALATMARDAGCGLVLLAHHGRDQAETVLLQALRGAGPAGLAAMPRVAQRDGIVWARPWLDQPRERIEAYARRWRLRGVADPSNSDERWARSRLRQRVWPVLCGAFGDAEVALQAVARRAAEARAVLDEVAAADATVVTDAHGLHREPWLELSEARRANVLRHWLAGLLPDGVPETLVQRLLHELPRSRDGCWPAPGAPLGLHRGVLQPAPAAAAPPAPGERIDLRAPGLHPLQRWPGALRVTPRADGGVPLALLAQVELRGRSGGERFQSHAGGVPRSLKKQFQAAALPRWRRDGPLLYADGRLLFVAGLGLDARACALPGAPRAGIEWLPQPPVSGREGTAD